MRERSGLERGLRGAEVVLGLAALAFVAFLFYRVFRPDAPRAELPGVQAEAPSPPPPFVLVLADSQEIELPPGEHFDTTFALDDPRECVLTGSVTGLEGGRRDVEVYVLDPVGAADWHDGVAPRALYASGRAAASTVDVALPSPGEYTLLISNQFSVLSGKRVLLEDTRVTCQ